MKIHTIPVLIAILGTFLNASAEVNLEVNGYPDPIKCDSANGYELTMFSLYSTTELEAAAKSQKLALPFEGKFSLAYTDESYITAARLDICYNGGTDTAILARIVSRVPGPGFAMSFVSDQFIPEDLSPNPALRDLMFDSPSNLELKFVNKKQPKFSYLLKAHGIVNGKPVVTISTYNSKTNTIFKPTGEGKDPGVIRVGQIYAGDPWEPKPMIATHRLVKIDKDGEKISISLNFEYRGKPGLYVGYKLNSAVVTDAKATYDGSATSNGCVVGVVAAGEPPSTCWEIKYSHHGLHDGFVLNFTDVSYELGGGKLVITRTDASNTITIKTIELDDKLDPYQSCDDVYQCGKEEMPSQFFHLYVK